MKPSVLITGSEGRLARTTLREALEPDHRIVGFDLVLGDDLLDRRSLDRKLDGVEAIVHTAAIPGPLGSSDRDAYERVNVRGTELLLEAALAAGVRKVVFFSSFARYGVDSWMRSRDEVGPVAGPGVAVPRYLPIDEAHPSILEYDDLADWGGRWYGESKARGEELGRAAGENGLAFVSLRLTGVRDPGPRWYARRRALLEDAADGSPGTLRKQWLYGASGVTPRLLLATTLRAVLQAEPAGYVPLNVTWAPCGCEPLVRAYFPDLPVTDTIFGTQALRVLLNQAGAPFEAPVAPPQPFRERARAAVRSLRP